MSKKRLFDGYETVTTFTGQAGMVIPGDGLSAVAAKAREGKRPGRYFAPGCGHHPDYVTQVPVLFEDGTYDVMRAMNIRKAPHLSEAKRALLEGLMRELVGQHEAGGKNPMESCIFCKIVRGEAPSIRVYEDEKVLAFADINPISPGHTLVIPKHHARDLWEIAEEDLAAVHLASKKIIRAMAGALHPSGVACLQLNGPGVNQVVPHYHLHLIPRIGEGPELPVTQWELTPGDMADIRSVADRISAAMGPAPYGP